ncbi:MAG: VOC family protein [Erysipelotrichaceae bacterium]|nr:VOC family protein [Erysipelotrichaceae bacterium]
MVKGIHHINIQADGREVYEKALHFYRDILGMKCLRSWNSGKGETAMLDGGNVILEIALRDNPSSKGTIQHFAIATDDPDGLMKVFEKEGYEVDKPVRDGVLHCEQDFPIRFGFVYGPCGEYIELFKEM